MASGMLRETKLSLSASGEAERSSFGEGNRAKGVSKSCSYFCQHVCGAWKSNGSEYFFFLLFTVSSGVVATLTTWYLDFFVNTAVIKIYWCQSSKTTSQIALLLPVLHFHFPQAGWL